ncbi:MAG: alpha/beta hydrolase, partial [Pseudomonadota bacterium]
ADVTALSDKLKQQKGITITHQTVPDAGHFFDPGMEEMIDLVEGYVHQRLVESGNLPAPAQG